MTQESIDRFKSLRAIEQSGGEAPFSESVPFEVALRRPWHQKAGVRASAEVNPGAELYVAVIADKHGMTYKIGSGKAEERIRQMNLYRRASQGEIIWAVNLRYQFETVDEARTAEDLMVTEIHRRGLNSKDHSEFAIGIAPQEMKRLFAKAVADASDMASAEKDRT